MVTSRRLLRHRPHKAELLEPRLVGVRVRRRLRVRLRVRLRRRLRARVGARVRVRELL